MAEINIPGISSKYNTNSIIEDLVAAERIKLDRMQEDLSRLEKNKAVWRQVNREFGNLQRTSKSLYGFENPFSDKLASSSNEQVLTALANRNAPIDNYSLTIKQVAASDRFLSSSLDESFRVDTGYYTFRIGAKSIDFRYKGGTLEDFSRRLTDVGEGLIRAVTVRDTPDTRVMIIEAIPTGAENKLIFENDSTGLGLKAGLLQKNSLKPQEVLIESIFENLKNSLASSEDRLALSDKGIIVGPNTTLRLPFEKLIKMKTDLVLEYKYRVISSDERDAANPLIQHDTISSKNQFGGDAPSKIPADKYFDEERVIRSREVLEVESSFGNVKLPPIDFGEVSGERIIRVESPSLPEDIRAIVLSNSDSDRSVEISDIRIYNPKQLGNLEPANPSSKAEDAIIEFMGIEIRRPDNSVDDLIDGLTLNIKRQHSEPVELSINPDVETAKENIIKFVFNYNQLMTRILVLTNDDRGIIDELEYLNDEEREALENQLGNLRGEKALTQVKSQLQNIVSNPYPTRAGNSLSLLAHIGISTNASSGNTSTVDFSKLRGYLEIDEEKLEMALENNITAVKELFGKDTSGDLVIDNGVARATDRFLAPYVRGGGFFGGRIARIDGQIDDVEEDISNYEQYLEEYEADLRRQYGNMEAILNQLENSSRELENFTRQREQ